MKRSRLIRVIVVAGLVCFSGFAEAAVWYVHADSAATRPDGTSWAKAFPDIQSGVDAAFDDLGGEVWVGQGTYTKTRSPVVIMKQGVSIYGGFLGYEPSSMGKTPGAASPAPTKLRSMASPSPMPWRKVIIPRIAVAGYTTMLCRQRWPIAYSLLTRLITAVG